MESMIMESFPSIRNAETSHSLFVIILNIIMSKTAQKPVAYILDDYQYTTY